MRTASIAAGLALFAATAVTMAQDDVFAFIPEGGRTLTGGLLAAGLAPAALAEATATPRTAPDWVAYLTQDGLAGAAGLEEWQRQTLADYLAYAGPLTDPATLPPDGRDMTLAQCQSCHIVTVVVTQDRTREAWLGTMGKPSHVGVPLTAEERGQLADYLVVNAGIPIEEVPPELRAGGASY
jgi:mono/diheme cytochrome c family protein